MGNVLELIEQLVSALRELRTDEQIEAINKAKVAIHEVSPFKDEPVDCVLWVKSDSVVANDYNPNKVAPPEMKLLHTSIKRDHYTQPIVVFPEAGEFTVIDGFHRHRIGSEKKDIRDRLLGYLPVTVINSDRHERSDRIAATIRHNRARGKHQVEAMSDIVVELSRRNHSDEWIAKELGMDPDEVLRLKQITGLAEMFADREFSEAWEAGDSDATQEPLESSV